MTISNKYLQLYYENTVLFQLMNTARLEESSRKWVKPLYLRKLWPKLHYKMYLCVTKVKLFLWQWILPWGWWGGGHPVGSSFYMSVIVMVSHPLRGPPVFANEALFFALNMLLLSRFLWATGLFYLLQVRPALLALQDIRQDQEGLLAEGWKAERVMRESLESCFLCILT